MIRKLITLFGLAAFAGSLSFAQTVTSFAGAANANSFAYGNSYTTIAPLQVDLAGGPTAAGVATLTVAYGNVPLGGGLIIAPLNVNAPIFVGVGANREKVTPTAVSCSTPNVYQSCSFTATFSNAHGTGDKVASASFGIQEAANYVAGRSGGGLVIVDGYLLKNAGITFTNAAFLTFISGFNSVSANVTVLNYMGVNGALSYAAASGSAYASTTHVIY